MAKEKMTIRDVHKATGLSEVTVSKLYHEKSTTIACTSAFNVLSANILALH
jgi:DNA-binding Xre family transcriptional regulator